MDKKLTDVTDNNVGKITDNEIVKALECCASDNINSCDNCPFYNQCENDENICKYALDLINRLQAENKRLSTLAELGNTRANDYRVMRDRALKAEAENERLKSKLEPQGFEEADPMDFCGVLCDFAEGLIAKAKAEAHKECIEKVEERIAVHLLRDKSNEYAEGFADALDGVNGEFDNLLKELIGE